MVNLKIRTVKKLVITHHHHHHHHHPNSGPSTDTRVKELAAEASSSVRGEAAAETVPPSAGVNKEVRSIGVGTDNFIIDGWGKSGSGEVGVAALIPRQHPRPSAASLMLPVGDWEASESEDEFPHALAVIESPTYLDNEVRPDAVALGDGNPADNTVGA